MSENTRLVWNEVAPQGAKAFYGIHHDITTGTKLPYELIHLVFLRVSQINDCAHCIDLHTRDLLKTMPLEKVALVPVWAEVPICSLNGTAPLSPGRRRSRWSARPTPPDEAYAATSAAFPPKDLVDLTITIAAMNAFNRLGGPFRLPVQAKA